LPSTASGFPQKIAFSPAVEQEPIFSFGHSCTECGGGCVTIRGRGPNGCMGQEIERQSESGNADEASGQRNHEGQ
jgi:hypothetical protein